MAKSNSLLNISFLLGIVLAISFSSCSWNAPIKEVHLVDSLNNKSFRFRYTDLQSSFNLAQDAYRLTENYVVGNAEAINNLGFSSFMQMDFDSAENYYKSVYRLTNNQLECLIADIGLMRIYQRTAMNKEFYDYRNSAQKRIRRIEEDESLFIDQRERSRLSYALAEFHLVSAIYYYYLQQKDESIQSIKLAEQVDKFNLDPSQILFLKYIKSSANLIQNVKNDKIVSLTEFDALFQIYQSAKEQNSLYLQASSLLTISNLLNNQTIFRFIKSARKRDLLELNAAKIDSTYSYQLSSKALRIFQEYGDLYQSASANVSIAKYLNLHGKYQEALNQLSLALDNVNQHHSFYYPKDTITLLKPYVANDSIFSELIWISKDDIKTVPEWISRIREQLSVSYAGLGKKAESDYNRNIYLDILDYTRQDKELESRFQSLETESQQLNLILFLVILGFVVLLVLLFLFNKNSLKRNKHYVLQLRQILTLCQKITNTLSTNLQSNAEDDKLLHFISAQVEKNLREILAIPDLEVVANPAESDKPFSVKVPQNIRLDKNQEALIQITYPYVSWTLSNSDFFSDLTEKQEEIEKKKYVLQQHITQKKRENIIKKACFSIVYGINPFIDRIINEVTKLLEKGYINRPQIKKEKLTYIDELISRINEYNDIITKWIKIKQGKLSLNIESFYLNDLFDIVAKAKRSFEYKGQKLEVSSADVWIKADKALTLFMINTLVENAHKYTQKGGVIKLVSEVKDEYVQIAIEDNGPGISAAKLKSLREEKVLKDPKNGFGLMNCKGIIEKYKKTDQLFKVCEFHMESTEGKGSRFSFRLPKGLKRVLYTVLILLLPVFTVKVSASTFQKSHRTKLANDTIVHKSDSYGYLLKEASTLADSAYYSNVKKDYKGTIAYAKKTIDKLNQYYLLNSNFFEFHPLMKVSSNSDPAELDWWDSHVISDYYVILDIRNELSVAYLALKKWEKYDYNNSAYSSLYKILSVDSKLQDYCERLERSTTNKTVGIILCVLILLTALLLYYIYYFRKRVINRMNLEQVIDINKQILLLSSLSHEDNDTSKLPKKMISDLYHPINDLFPIINFSISIFNEKTNQLNHFSSHESEEINQVSSDSFEKAKNVIRDEYWAFPLMVTTQDSSLRCIGTFALRRYNSEFSEEEFILIELIVKHISMAVFNVMAQLKVKYRNIELSQDEAQRAIFEEENLHVQNMVLDNCLSAIKHETVYYPNKIKQVVNKLSNEEHDVEAEKKLVEDISELIQYYKGIFTTLSSCAERQLEEITFRRTKVLLSDVAEYAKKSFKRRFKKNLHQVDFEVESIENYVVGDKVQINLLLDALLDEASRTDREGKISLSMHKDGEFVRFDFNDYRRTYTQIQLNELFYPNNQTIGESERGEIYGIEFLICKQIIREHDEYALRRGCRINAEPLTGGGFKIYFTLPRKD